MPVTARPAPSTEAATLALTSSTFAILAPLLASLMEQCEHPDTHAGEEYRSEAGDGAGDRCPVDLAVTAPDEPDGHPAEAEGEHGQAEPAEQGQLGHRPLRSDQVEHDLHDQDGRRERTVDQQIA